MIDTLKFKDLPFKPDMHYIVYVENEYDDEVNRYIQDNYEAIKDCLGNTGYKFVYMPFFANELNQNGVLPYYAPYLDLANYKPILTSSWLLDYLENPADKTTFQPSLLFWDAYGHAYALKIHDFEYTKTNNFYELFATIIVNNTERINNLGAEPTDESDLKYKDKLYRLAVKEAQERECRRKAGMMEQEARILAEKDAEEERFRLLKDAEEEKKRRAEEAERKRLERERKKKSFFERFKKGFDNLSVELFASEDTNDTLDSTPTTRNLPFTADDRFTIESRALLEEVIMKIDQLRQRGISQAMLEAIIHKEEKLSRLVITKDYDIYLPDYHNMEIKMAPLSKAVFILFLRHPEGIIFKHLPDYHDELLGIYSQLKDGMISSTHRKSIDDITNPFNNSINEKCARIREAFVSKFDERLANHYCVDGRRGEAKKIDLPRDLVIWE